MCSAWRRRSCRPRRPSRSAPPRNSRLVFPLKDDNPSRTTPVFTIALIIVNVLVFLYQFSLEVGGREGARGAESFIREFGLVPFRLTGACHGSPDLPSPVLTIFTSMFMHGGWFHVCGHLLYLA